MNKKFISITAIMTLTMIIYNMGHPVTPQMVSELNQGPTFLGIVFAAMAFTNFLMSPLWGNLSDRYGRKPFMLFAPIGYGIAQVGFGLSTATAPILFFRLLSGALASASMIGGTAYLVDITTSEERSSKLVIFTAITGFATTGGYLLGGWIGNENYRYAFIAQGILCVVLSLVILVGLKEGKERASVSPGLEMVKRLKTYRGTVVIPLLLVVFLMGVVYKGFDTSFNSFLKFDLNATPFIIGVAMAISGLIGMVTNFMIFPLLKRRYNDLYVLLSSIAVMAITALVFVFADGLAMQAILLVFFFGALALYKPLLQAILSKTGERSGELMGLNNAANSIGTMVGSLALGAIYDVSNQLAFVTLMIFSVMSIAILLQRRRRILPYVIEGGVKNA